MAGDGDVVLGIDAGTTSAKTVAVDRAGRVAANGGSDEIATDTSTPGGSEQAPEQIWRAVAQAVRRATASLDAGAAVVALAIGAQSGSVVPIGTGGEPGPVVTWMDTRSAPLVAAWPAAVLDQVRATSGWSASAGLGLATIGWLRDTGRAATVERWASVDDFLMHELTGSWVTNPSNAAGMQLMDVAALQWSKRLRNLAGVATDQLSIILPSGTPVGALRRTAAASLGLPRSARAVVGGHDQACAALGLGAVMPGNVVLSAGTAWVITAVTPSGAAEELPAGFNLGPHVLDSQWTASRNLGPLGAAIASILAEEPDDGLDPESTADEPRLDDCYFLPAVDDPDRIGWGRFAAPVEALSLSGKLRAVFEACAFEVRAAIDQAPGPARTSNQVTFVGGGTRSELLKQIIADATERDLVVHPDTSWPALGAARLAAGAMGWDVPDLAGDAAGLVRHRPSTSPIYRQRYEAYRDLTREARA